MTPLPLDPPAADPARPSAASTDPFESRVAFGETAVDEGLWLEEIAVPLVSETGDTFTATVLGRAGGHLVFERQISVLDDPGHYRPAQAFERADLDVPHELESLEWDRRTIWISTRSLRGDGAYMQKELEDALVEAARRKTLPDVVYGEDPAAALTSEDKGTRRAALERTLAALRDLCLERSVRELRETLKPLGIDDLLTDPFLESLFSGEPSRGPDQRRKLYAVAMCLHPLYHYHWTHVARTRTDANDKTKRARIAEDLAAVGTSAGTSDLWQFAEELHPDSQDRFGAKPLLHPPQGFSNEWRTTGFPSQVEPRRRLLPLIPEAEGGHYLGSSLEPTTRARGPSPFKPLILVGILPLASARSPHDAVRSATAEIEAELEHELEEITTGLHAYDHRNRSPVEGALDDGWDVEAATDDGDTGRRTAPMHAWSPDLEPAAGVRSPPRQGQAERRSFKVSVTLARLLLRVAVRSALAGPRAWDGRCAGRRVASLARHRFHGLLRSVLEASEAEKRSPLGVRLIGAMEAVDRLLGARASSLWSDDDGAWTSLEELFASARPSRRESVETKVLLAEGRGENEPEQEFPRETLALGLVWLMHFTLEELPTLEEERRLVQACERLAKLCKGAGTDLGLLHAQAVAFRRTHVHARLSRDSREAFARLVRSLGAPG